LAGDERLIVPVELFMAYLPFQLSS
jgi:hypothetical protein